MKIIRGLRAFYNEINERDYKNILGLKARISYAAYFRMLEVLPPMNYDGTSWCMCEFLTGPLTTKFYKQGKSYYAEVVDYRNEKKVGVDYHLENDEEYDANGIGCVKQKVAI